MSVIKSMNESREDIIIADTLSETAELQLRGYIVHALCHSGEGSFRMGEAVHHFGPHDCIIISQQSILMMDIRQSDDMKMEVVYVSQEFIAVATPQSNYGMRGHLALFEAPVMHLNEAQYEVCAVNFEYIRRRLALPQHHFHRDAMLNAIQCMIIDFFDFHVELYGSKEVSGQQAQLMQKFLAMLDRGDYRQHRLVSYYAGELCVTPKYLSEVCNNISGQPAIYWITRYTALDISRLLRQQELSLEDISDMFGFSSMSYFVRYVQKNLGAAPSELRK